MDVQNVGLQSVKELAVLTMNVLKVCHLARLNNGMCSIDMAVRPVCFCIMSKSTILQSCRDRAIFQNI